VLTKRARGENYLVDPLVLIFLSFSILVNSYLSVKYSASNIYISVVNLLYICLSLSGLMLHHVFCGGIKFDKELVKTEFTRITLYSIVGFVLVLISQTFIFKLQSGTVVLATIIETKLFYLTAAVSEELFFRYYIQTKIGQSLPMVKGLSVVITSMLFTVYHFTVYGSNIYALYAVFYSSLVLSVIYYLSKRLSTSMLVHAMVNLIAS